MLERFLILAVLLAGIFFCFKKYFSPGIGSAGNILQNIPGIDNNLPTIIYFWSEYCRPCFTMQNPALLQLKKNGHFNLVSFNAVNKGELIKELNIKTVPATVVIASGGSEIKFINNGYAGEELLSSQLHQAL
jgi:thiol-disulfide isomerase/thioredoxin